MPKTTLAGHPLHPQLIALPAALLPTSLAFDVLYMATGKQSYADAAYYTMVGGAGGALVAGAAGAGDFLAIPDRTRAKKIAALHGLMNAGIVALYGANLALRRRHPERRMLPFAMSLAGTVGLMVSSWYGGHLVYAHGVRVQGANELRGEGLKLPGDEQIEVLFTKLEEATVIADRE